MLSVMVFGDGISGRCLGNGALMSEISVHVKETPETQLAPFIMWSYSEKTDIHEEVNLVAWTSSPHNCGKEMSLVYKLPSI